MNQLELQFAAPWMGLSCRLFDRDVVIIGGSIAGDRFEPSKKERAEKIFVQLNHHWLRRFTYQPCDWLISRKGSGMSVERLKKEIPEESLKRLEFISCQVNNLDHYLDWSMYSAVNQKFLFPFHETGYIKQNPFHPTLEWCNQFWNEIGTNPFIGILAIRMILLFPIRSLQVVGFDFFKKPEGGFFDQLSCHNIKRQVLWLLHQYNTDMRISVDDSLIKVFNSFGEINRGLIGSYDSST
jgi:hypothetical protein